jgi:hypothetical protein
LAGTANGRKHTALTGADTEEKEWSGEDEPGERRKQIYNNKFWEELIACFP